MFQTISWVTLITVLAGIVLHALAFPWRPTGKKKTAKGGSFWWCGWNKNLRLLGKLKRLSCVLAVGCLGVLFITGFVGRLFYDQLMTGYTLMLHVGLSPVFIVCLTFIVITWADQCRLNNRDWKQLTRLVRLQTAGVKNSGLGWKLSFWLAMFLAIPASLSMLLSMFTLFGTHGQEVLFGLHQYTSLGLTLVAMIHVYLVIRWQYK